MYDPRRKSLVVTYEHLLPYVNYVAWYKGYSSDPFTSSGIVSKSSKQKLLEDFSQAYENNMVLYERLQKLKIEETQICRPQDNAHERNVSGLLLEMFVQSGIAYSVTQCVCVYPSVHVATGSVGYLTDQGGFVVLGHMPEHRLRIHEPRASSFSILTGEIT